MLDESFGHLGVVENVWLVSYRSLAAKGQRSWQGYVWWYTVY
jgi:hypothetical protein